MVELIYLGACRLRGKFTSYNPGSITSQPRRNDHLPAEMSKEKRPANEAFGTSQLVKRTKSDANLGSSAVAKVNGSGANGALIQAVCTIHSGLYNEYQS